jgi:hypothetical protein
MPVPGRNDPCSCGSGKKYKRCCLGREHERDTFARELEQHGLPLLRELGRYAVTRSASPPEKIAGERFPFWRPPLDRIRASRLLDYLIFDHRPTAYGNSAAQDYLQERAPLLNDTWRRLLADWQNSTMRLYVLDQWSGGFARCRCVLPQAAQTIEVMPLERAEAKIADESPIALRALPLGNLFVYASWPTTFGDRSVEDVRESVVARHHAYVRRERIVSIEEFLGHSGTVFDEEAAAVSTSKIILPGRS